MARLLVPADYRSMPWKNGGGLTTQIVVHPAGASTDDFSWRVSVAQIERDGPFSPFPGIDRTIVLLEGSGMRLRGGFGEVDLKTPFTPHAFRGDQAVDCTLISGPVRDFNAMFRRGKARGTVRVVRGEQVTIASSDYRLVYAAEGTHDCVAPGLAPVTIAPGHALLVEPVANPGRLPISVAPMGTGATAIVVSIDCR